MGKKRVKRSANSIMVISPYEHNGLWVFDDDVRGLVREPFVAGIPEMITHLMRELHKDEKKFNLTFSATGFPGSQRKLVWNRKDGEGNWYKMDGADLEGWLCPALFKFFDEAPKEIHCQISF